MNTPWSDWQKWWMDIAKTVVGAFLGFAIAFTVFDWFEQDRAERRALCVQKVDRMYRTLAGLQTAGSNYRTAAHNTLIELYRWRDEQPTEPMRRWWGPAYAELEAALRGFDVAFPEAGQATSSIRKSMDRLYKILDQELIDPRLDDIADLYHRENPPTEEERRQAASPLPREKIDRRRPDVEKELATIKEAQDRLGNIASTIIMQPASAVCKSREIGVDGAA